MKNEALSDAVSMIDDRFIAEAQEPFQKRRSSPLIIKICAAAACAAAAAFLLIPRGQSADILIYGENPAKNPVAVRSVSSENSAARAFSIEIADIPVTVSAAGKTEVSVSSGELFLNENGSRTPAENSLTLEKSAEILWSVALTDKEQQSTLTVKTAKQSQILTLSFDEGSGNWIISRQ